MEGYDSKVPQGNMRHFTWLVMLAQVLGLVAVILTAVWMGHFEGGFAWQSDPQHEFNYHPLFMIIGMVFLYADAMLAYRVFRNDRKIYVKILHAGIHCLALVFAAVGLKAVFDSHNLVMPPIANMYSVHSWLGLTTVILFGLQWVIGFCSFMFPKIGVGARRMVLPLHVFFGMMIFCMATGTALIGILEKAMFSLGAGGYSQKPPVAMLLNSLGLVLVAFAALVVYILTRPEYERQPSPDEEHIQLAE